MNPRKPIKYWMLMCTPTHQHFGQKFREKKKSKNQKIWPIGPSFFFQLDFPVYFVTTDSILPPSPPRTALFLLPPPPRTVLKSIFDSFFFSVGFSSIFCHYSILPPSPQGPRFFFTPNPTEPSSDATSENAVLSSW